MEKIFDSKYPIVEAGMNPASTLRLALAVHEAGGFPCIALWAYLNESEEGGLLHLSPNIAAFDAAMTGFVSATGTNHLLVTLFGRHIFNLDVFEILSRIKPRAVEVVLFDRKTVFTASPELVQKFVRSALKYPSFKHLGEAGSDMRDWSQENMDRFKSQILRTVVDEYRKLGCYIFTRSPAPTALENMHCGFALDGLFIKGAESGGRNSELSVWENFVGQQALTPQLACIPFGGVGTPQQVKKYIAAGAQAVGIGTLLAASEESPLSMDVKQKMVSMKKEDLTQIGPYKQNALVFQKIAGPDDFNSNKSLRRGLFGDATVGHMYAGHSIDYVTGIRPVKEIVEYLVSEL